MSATARNKIADSHPLSLRFWRLFDRIGPFLLLLVLVLAITAVHPAFLRGSNLLTIGLQASVNALLAIGETLVIVSGGIDLSVGTMMSLSMVYNLSRYPHVDRADRSDCHGNARWSHQWLPDRLR